MISVPNPIYNQAIPSFAGLELISNSSYIAIKASVSDKILIADLDAMLEELKNRKRLKSKSDINLLTLKKVTKLIHIAPKPGCDPEFIFMSENCGIIACGDHLGRVLLYDCRKMIKNKPLSPIKILEGMTEPVSH